MIRISKILCVILCVLSVKLHAQTDEYWNFRHSGLKFTSGVGVIDSTNNNCNVVMTNCQTSVCGSNKGLKFYSNGYNVYDRNNSIMPNGNHFNHSNYGDTYINGNSAYPLNKGAIIVPFVNDTNKYYMFYEDLSYDELGSGNFLPGKLRYLVIDKTLNNGMGDVVFKDSSILNTDTLIAGNIFVTKNGSGDGWWVIVRKFHSNIFFKILIDIGGIHSPTTQAIGNPYTLSNVYPAIGDLSLDGSKIIYLNTNWNLTVNGQLDVIDFDRCSGNLSNFKSEIIPSISGQDTLVLWSSCISPNNKYLYCSNGTKMWQMDLSNSNIINSRINVGSWDGTKVIGNPTWFYQMKNAIDNRTYVGTYGGNSFLHVINFPDSLGAVCNFVQKQIFVGTINNGHLEYGALPNTPNYKLGAINCNVGMDSKLVDSDKGLNIFPNPTHTAEFTLSVQSNETDKAQLQISNYMGQIILNESVQLNDKNQWHFDLSKYPNGTYLITLKTTSEKFSDRVMVVR